MMRSVGLNPSVTGIAFVEPSVIRRPPRSTKSRRAAAPFNPIPGRRSSVSSQRSRFGVSALFFHGIGGPIIGRPVISTVVVGTPTCGNTTTSNRSSAPGLCSDWSEIEVYGIPI